MHTYDSRIVDSTGSFLIGQLEKLDPMLHLPLQNFTFTRDIDMREDVTMAEDFSSFTASAMASVGGIDSTKKAWISNDSSTLPSVALDIGKTTSPLLPWGLNLSYSIFELQAAMKLGQSIDVQKFLAVQRKLNQDTDIQVYLGDGTIPNAAGLLNSSQVTVNAAVPANGTGSSTLWTNKTPAQILQDINALLETVWAASGFEICPTKLLLPPVLYGYLATTVVSTAGSVSILTYLEDNSIALRVNGKKLGVLPLKWCTGTNNGNLLGVNATDMMVAYTPRYDLVRFPRLPIMGLETQFEGIYQKRPYVCKLGLVEFVYPETVGYAYGIN